MESLWWWWYATVPEGETVRLRCRRLWWSCVTSSSSSSGGGRGGKGEGGRRSRQPGAWGSAPHPRFPMSRPTVARASTRLRQLCGGLAIRWTGLTPYSRYIISLLSFIMNKESPNQRYKVFISWRFSTTLRTKTSKDEAPQAARQCSNTGKQMKLRNGEILAEQNPCKTELLWIHRQHEVNPTCMLLFPELLCFCKPKKISVEHQKHPSLSLHLSTNN